MKRTGSIRSYVGPEVISSCFPASVVALSMSSSILRTISSGSGSRPLPMRWLASSPSSASSIVAPISLSRAAEAMVDGWRYISRSIAGAM